MMDRSSIFAADDAFEDRLVTDRDELAAKVAALKTLGQKIVLTSGSFDMPHNGHWRYLREARKCGDILIVGVDSDEKVRSRKKDSFRPIYPEMERAEALSHTRYPDIVTIKALGEEQWGLIKLVRPDVLVVSERNDSDEAKLAAIKEFCGEIVVLPPQATTSTSANIRKMLTGALVPALMQVRELIESLIHKAQGGGDRS